VVGLELVAEASGRDDDLLSLDGEALGAARAGRLLSCQGDEVALASLVYLEEAVGGQL
jgi:hypothetical protein